ncbi:polyprotein [Lysiphlebus fabarum rna-virus type B]|nr:polyprotein [Lysiphlebus fabarum rna-virus type B]
MMNNIMKNDKCQVSAVKQKCQVAAVKQQSKFIARPIIRTKQYIAPSAEGAKEYNEIRKEFRLFEGFTVNPKIIEMRRLSLKLKNLQQQLAGVWKNVPVNNLVSYSKVAKRNSNPKDLSIIPAQDLPEFLISRADARRDYSEAFKLQKKQKVAAFAIVQGMANRRPIVIRGKVRDRVDLVSESTLDQMRSFARKDKKCFLKPKEVKEFSPFCYYPKEEYDLYDHNKTVCEDKVGKIYQTSQKQVKVKTFICEKSQDRGEKPYETVIKVTRSQRMILLLSKLSKTPLGKCLASAIIAKKIKQNPKLEQYVDFNSDCVEPQMDPEGVVGKTANSGHQASNTVIDNLQPIDKGVFHSNIQGYHNYSVSKERQSFDVMHDRWIFLKSVDWNAADGIDKELYKIEVPFDILKSNYDSPNAQLFLTHRWNRTNVRLRFCLNSNQFQVGQVVASVLYGRYNENLNLWNNVYSALQRNHARMLAGSSNDAELVIPYHWYNSMMTLTKSDSFATISLRVLNPLIAAASVAAQCSISVFATFEDASFHGMVQRVEPQMETAFTLMNVGGRAVRALNKEFNRDNPPLSLQPVSFVPQAMPSLSYMDHVGEPINMLRADPRGQTPHCDLSDELNPTLLARGWSYVGQTTWKTTDETDTLLLALPVVPLMIAESYPSVRLADVTQIPRVYTTLAYISAYYGKWRGDIEFKFQIVGSKFHTGRLIVGSIPLSNYSNPPIQTLKFSANKIFDIADNTELIFRAPWQWKNSFASTRTTEIAGDVPSQMYVKVINRLIAIEQVPTTLYINVFVRASDNFELAIPKPSILDPAISDPMIAPGAAVLTPYNVENKWYTTYQRNLKDKNGKYRLTIFIQDIIAGWVGYSDLKPYIVYKLLDKTSINKRGFRIQYYTSETTLVVASLYGVYDEELSAANAHGLILFDSLERARTYIQNLVYGVGTARMYALEWFKDGPWSEIKIGNKWIEAPNDGDFPVWQYVEAVKPKFTLKNGEGFEVVEPQMDTDAKVPITTLDVPTDKTTKGLLIFGEECPDLKSLCRRFNIFTTIRMTTCSQGLPRDCPYSARMRVFPIRKVNPASAISFDNRHRHGIISSIASMYRLWRGSLRYRFVVVGSPPEGTTVYVQHRFDYDFRNSEMDVVLGPSKASNRSDLMSTQYATFAQALGVNSTFTIEVPYYKENEALSLLPSSYEKDRMNGSLFIWVHSGKEETLHLEVYYSLADDTRFSVFQGTPVAFDMTTFDIAPQMEDEPVIVSEGNLGSKSLKLKPEEVKKTKEGIIKSVKGFFQSSKQTSETIEVVSKDVSKASLALEATCNRLTDMAGSLSSFVEGQADTFKETVVKKGVSTIFDVLFTMKDKIFSIVTHIVYSIISPCATTLAWAIVNLYHTIFGFTMDGVDKLMSIIKALFTRMMSPTKQPQGETIKPQSDFDSGTDRDIASYASLLFTSIATLCKLKATPPTSWKGIADGLFNFSHASRGGHFIGQFVLENIEFFKRVYQRFLRLFGIKSQNYKLISGIEDTRLRDWFMESTIVLAPQYMDHVVNSPEWSQKVFELAVVGRALQTTLVIDAVTPPKIMTLLNENLKQLKTLEKKLIDKKIYSGVRYEPFCLWLSGDAGVGKSRFLQDVAEIAAVKVGYTGQVSYCPLTTGQKYFDSFNNQPTLMIDDFLSMTAAVDPESYSQFLQMKSAALFNPPYAQPDEKCKLINFLNLFVSSNATFVRNMAGIHDFDAYNRRRDLVLTMKFRDPTMTSDKSRETYTSEQFQNLEHVLVYHHPSVLRDQGEILIPLEEGKSYRSVVMKFVEDRMKAYHDKEIADYKRTCNKIIERLDSQVERKNEFSDMLKAFREDIDKISSSKSGIEGNTLQEGDFLNKWLRSVKESATHKLEPQMNTTKEEQLPCLYRTEFDWPNTVTSDADDSFVEFLSKPEEFQDETVHPVTRLGCCLPKYSGHNCLHLSFDFEMYTYEKDFGIYHSSRIADHSSKVSYSCNDGPCLKFVNGEYVTVPECIFNDKQYNRIYSFYNKLIANPQYPHILQECKLAETTKDWSVLERDLSPTAIYICRKTFEDDYSSFKKILDNQSSIMAQMNTRSIEIEQSKIRGTYEIVDSIILPKKSLIRRIGEKIWSGLLKLFSILSAVATFVQKSFTLIISAFFLVGVVSHYIPKEKNEADIEGQIHPSGDFKTIRSQKTIRNRCLNLVRSEGNDVSTEQDLVKLCSLTRQNGGLLNKLVQNSFFLIGMVENDEGSYHTYRARCLGLFNKKFLVLKHYIEHFKSVGVTKVAVVYHNSQGCVQYQLNELKFEWTSQGYGVGELPRSAPKQFSDITKYMPSEKFDGSYPRDCVIFEVFNEEVLEHNVPVKLLKRPIEVPGTSTQDSWTIHQGFEYNWGGKGRCGSFIIAPTLACPLIGIHTAGIGDKKGFGEILLKETFKPEQEHIIHYVTPQMEQSPNVYGLDGDYLQVGSLDKDLVPRSNNKTRICPSLVHGVFDVKTGPAPLVSSDERLAYKADIFKIGTSKRCSPMIEFPRGTVQDAYLNLYELLENKVKPIRSNIEPLSVVQAIEGFHLEGYDSMEMKTSEGYPWINMRPKGESDKSWLFKLSQYETGRLKVEGISDDLQQTLSFKMKLRENNIVPASYFTACLKDARILLDKIPEPGKTRIFEISPVDLSIAQRQYYLDFTVSYRKARLQAENSIGINPDGKEWTELANHMLDFSPLILTADFSGFGPRMSHECLERAFMLSIAWFEHYEDCDEEERARRFSVRMVIMHEVTHGLHIAKDLVFRPTSGLPSGNCETVERNSMVNSLYFRIAYIELAKRYCPSKMDVYFFDKYVRIVHNGDDVIASVKEEIISWFNNETLIEFFGQYKLKMTDALKQGKVRKYCSLEEASYLKRGFLKHPTRQGQWLAPLEETSITETANWVWKSTDHLSASKVNSEMCWRLAYTRGPEFYYKICKTLKKKWKELEEDFEYPSWETLDSNVWDETQGPFYNF